MHYVGSMSHDEILLGLSYQLAENPDLCFQGIQLGDKALNRLLVIP